MRKKIIILSVIEYKDLVPVSSKISGSYLKVQLHTEQLLAVLIQSIDCPSVVTLSCVCVCVGGGGGGVGGIHDFTFVCYIHDTS